MLKSNDVSLQRKMELIYQLYDYLGRDFENVKEDIELDALTCNSGNDGNDYYWYIDIFSSSEEVSVAISMDGNIIDETINKNALNEILYIKE